MWFAGIDWADQHHDVVVVNAAGDFCGHCRVAHSVAGLDALLAFLRTFTTDLEELLCVVELDHGLLVAALLDAGLPVAALNPVTAKRLRPPSGVKTDTLDALLLARAARAQWPAVPRLRPQSALVQELKLLTRDLERLIGQQTSLTNQLGACLKHYYPVALSCFDSVALPIALLFLQHFPTPVAARQASVEQLTDFLVTARYPRSLPATRAKAEQLAAVLQSPQLQAPAPVVRAKAQLTQVLVAQLLLLHEQIAAYDAAIGALAHQHEDHALFASLPGAGPRLAPRLLAEWGDDRTLYANAASVQALAGTAPVLFQSGAYRGVRRRRACVNALRQALYHFARESVVLDEWARAYYRRKRAQGRSQAMALRALANHWVRILYAMWLHRTPYDPAILQAAQQAHGSEAVG
jgi:transposase